MNRIALAFAAAVLTASGALAGDLFATAYGNTITQTLPNGSKTMIYVNADKSWEQHTGSHVVKGIYMWRDATHACFTVTDPAPKNPAQATNCSEITQGHKVGDTWTETMGDGQAKMTLAITAGR